MNSRPSDAKPLQRPFASEYEELKPLIKLCEAGRLFAVQDWIASGKPIDLAPVSDGGNGASPLRVAVDIGFHSLVEVFLKGGSRVSPESLFSPIYTAIYKRRFDLVKLFIENGVDPKSVHMTAVFESWDPEMMAYFIERDADLDTQNPFAYAFSQKVRTALGPFKKQVAIKPHLIEQANIALRYHCKHGNLKWVALMLWLGADPYVTGQYENYERSGEYDNSRTALELAAINGHFDVFKLKKISLEAANKALALSLESFCREGGLATLRRLLKSGINPNDRENGGCGAIFSCFSRLSMPDFANYWATKGQKRDSDRARASMDAIGILAEHGAKWVPYRDVNGERRNLLKVPAFYTTELVQIMAKYKACEFDTIKALIKSPTLKRHLGDEWGKVKTIVDNWGNPAK